MLKYFIRYNKGLFTKVKQKKRQTDSYGRKTEAEANKIK